MNFGRRLARLGRAPLPEWQELAWVAGSRSWLPAGLTRWLADNLYLVALPYLGLVVALLAQQPVWALGFALLAALGSGRRAGPIPGRPGFSTPPA